MRKEYVSPCCKQILFAREEDVITASTPQAEDDFFTMSVTSNEIFE